MYVPEPFVRITLAKLYDVAVGVCVETAVEPLYRITLYEVVMPLTAAGAVQVAVPRFDVLHFMFVGVASVFAVTATARVTLPLAA